MAGFLDFLNSGAAAGGPPVPDSGGWQTQVNGPSMWDKLRDGAGDFTRGMQDTVQHPFFQMGAGMMAAGGEGKNVGAGFAAGAKQANTSQQEMLQTQSAQRQMAAQKMRDDFQASLNGPNAPPWFKAMSPQMQGVLRALPPDQSGQIMGQQAIAQSQIGAQMSAKKQEMEYARELDLKQRQDTLNLMEQWRQRQQGGQTTQQPAPADGRYKYVPGVGFQ